MQKPSLRTIRLKNFPILKQLQLEEALLRVSQENWCVINEGSPKAVVLGISGKTEELVEKEKLARAPIPVIRRFSGGGTVIVDEETIFVTMICNSSAVEIPAFPQQILSWNGSLYEHPLRGTSFQLQENDYAFGSRKFGGNAQYICKNRWLHHSTLLWDFDSSNMDYLKIPRKMPSYRENRPHDTFLCRMKDTLSDKAAFLRDLEASLARRFSLEPASLDLLHPILSHPHRKQTAEE